MKKMLTRLPVATLILGVAAIIAGCAFTSEAAKVTPTISSLSPSSIVAGSSGFTLTVHGANFQPSDVVLWNGTQRTTTFNSKNQLQAAILSTDVAQPSTVQISVLQPRFKTNVSSPFTFVIPAPLQVVTSSLPTAMNQKPYDASLSGSGGIPPYVWSIGSGQLPTGLALDSGTGVISGTTTSIGTYSFTVQVKDSEANPQSASKGLKLGVVAPPSTLVISATTLPNGTVQAAYSATLAASGGLTPYNWSITSGALPPGLSLNASTGAILGTPTKTGGFTFTVDVKDSESSPQNASNTFSISIAAPAPPPLSITTSSLSGGQANVSYSTTLAASGGTTPYSWSVTAGALPGGLTLNSSSGAISGTPSASGSFTFTVQAKDSAATPQTASKQFSISIAAAAPPPLSITTSSLPGGTVGTSYSSSVAASGGTAPYAWSITAGALPDSLALNSSSGAISGTPSVSGTFTFTVQVKDSAATPQTASKQLSIAIAAAPAPSVAIRVSSGGSAYTDPSGNLWSADTGFTGGLTFTNTASVAGTSTPVLYNTERYGYSIATASAASFQYAFTVPNGSYSIALKFAETYLTGAGQRIFNVAINGQTVLSNFDIFAAAGGMNIAVDKQFAVNVTNGQILIDFTPVLQNPKVNAIQLMATTLASPSLLSVTTSSLPGGTAGASYSTTLAASGGTTPYSWSVTAGALPGGLALNSSTGAISGTPSASGTFTFTVQAKDSAATPQTASKQLSIAIAATGPSTGLAIITSSLPGGTVGASYSTTLAASGGTTPYSWSVSGGSLPGGLSLNSSTGAISGTPSASGTFTFTVQAKDSSATPQTASKQLSISIAAAAPPPLSITTSSLPGGQVNVSYSTTLAASGGTTPYSWSVTAGALPGGLALNSSSGAISGTPSASGSFTFTVQAKDSAATPQTASKQFSISIAAAAPPPLSITTSSLPAGTVGTSYSSSVAASGGTAPYSWSITAGALPGSLTLNSSSGAISGMPSASGTFTFTVQVKDSAATPQTASKQLSIAISAGPAPSSTSAIPATYFGMNLGSRITPWPTVPFGSLRLWDSNVSWAEVNTSQGVYDWTGLDNWIATAQSNGQDLLYTFGRTPQWASSDPTNSTCAYASGECAPPSDLNSDGTGTDQFWKDYVTAIVTHAAGKIKYWEIWNEPTYSGTWIGTTAQLVRMAQDAYTIVKSIDPTAQVLTPSVSAYHFPGGGSNIATWLGQYFAAGGAAATDIVAFHGYYYTTPEDINTVVNNIKAAMNANGQGSKPLWDTEASWGTSSDLSDQTLQANFLARYYILHWSDGVARFYWYAWYDGGFGSWGALYSPTTGIYPAGVAYGQVSNWLAGATLSTPCSMASNSTWTCVLTRSGGYQALAIWNPTGSVSYAPSSIYTQYRDLTGNVTPISGSVTIGPSPILLEAGAGSSVPPPAVSVTISPTSATVPSAGTQQFTATVSNTSNTGVTWTVTAGSVSSSGLFTAPTVTVNTSVTVKATSAADPTKSASASVAVTAPASLPLVITTTSLSGGTVNTGYSTTLAASGGTTPYSWSVTAGVLPGGLTLNSSSGAISGTPSASGSFSFTVQAKDSASTPQTASKQLSISIAAAAPPPLSITTSSLPGGQVNVSYSTTLAASGGTTPYSWSLTAGALPGGLALNSSSGAISGTPSASGSFTFTVQAKDSASTPQTASKQLSISIAAAAPPPLSITSSSLPGGTVNVAYTATLAATGGVSPYTWSLSSGTLPNGLTLASSTGVISGTPTLAGSFSFGMKVTDSAASSTTATFSITIASPSATPQLSSLVIVALENTDYSSVVGNSCCPTLNSLIAQGGLATQYYADTHPSIGNYFMVTTGQILTNDDSQTPQSFPVSVDNIIHELELNYGTSSAVWKDYPEMTGTYYVRHDPIQYFTNVNKANISDFSHFAADMNAGTLPRFAWVTPNGCNDGHDCGVGTADTWVKNNIIPYLSSAQFKAGGALIIWFDESGGDNTNGGGRVYWTITSPRAKVAFQSTTLYQHESTLRMMCEALGLTSFPGAAASAPNMFEFFVGF